MRLGRANRETIYAIPSEGGVDVKMILAIRIEKMVQRMGWSQYEACTHMGCNQYDVSNIINGKLSRYSLQRLLRYAVNMGLEIDLTVNLPMIVDQRKKVA